MRVFTQGESQRAANVGPQNVHEMPAADPSQCTRKNSGRGEARRGWAGSEAKTSLASGCRNFSGSLGTRKYQKQEENRAEKL